MAITPEQLASSGSEDGHQLALFCWCRLNYDKYPELKWLLHIPNGGSRHKSEAAKLKAMGVSPGFPDLFLPIKRGKFSGLMIELKRPNSVGKKAGKSQSNQKIWRDHLYSQDYGAIECFGWEHAVSVLKDYLGWKE